MQNLYGPPPGQLAGSFEKLNMFLCNPAGGGVWPGKLTL